MDKKDSSKTVHSDSSERDPLFEAAARQFIADGYVTISMFTSVPLKFWDG